MGADLQRPTHTLTVVRKGLVFPVQGASESERFPGTRLRPGMGNRDPRKWNHHTDAFHRQINAIQQLDDHATFNQTMSSNPVYQNWYWYGVILHDCFWITYVLASWGNGCTAAFSPWCSAAVSAAGFLPQNMVLPCCCRRGVLCRECVGTLDTRVLCYAGKTRQLVDCLMPATLCVAMSPHQFPESDKGSWTLPTRNRTGRGMLHRCNHQRNSALITNGSFTTNMQITSHLCNGRKKPRNA